MTVAVVLVAIYCIAMTVLLVGVCVELCRDFIWWVGIPFATFLLVFDVLVVLGFVACVINKGG